MDEIPSKRIRLGDNTLNNINDIEAQEASDCQENVLKSSGENHTLSPSKICDNCSEEVTARNQKRLVNLGSSDYDELNGCMDFIDKSLFAWHFYDDHDSPLLVTAPSRFGKTSILKMLEKFFGIDMSSGFRRINVIEKDGRFIEDLENMSKYFKIFKTKKIFEMCHCSPSLKSCDKCKQWFYEHCGQHPVISIDFGVIDTTSKKSTILSLKDVITIAFENHAYLVTEVDGKMVWSSTKKEQMGIHHVNKFLRYCYGLEHDKFWLNTNIDEECKNRYVVNGLPFLAQCLSLHFKTEETGKGVILLIDEFDAFACEMIFESGEEEVEIKKNIKDISMFIRHFTRKILKECPFVKKALLMACCAMGGIVSVGANNTQIRYFLDSHSFSESFGFTENEVKFLVNVYLEKNTNESKETMLRNIDEWYNGYSVIKTGKKIFSSFSILKYLRNSFLRCYWKDKVGSSRLDALLAERPFHNKVFSLLNCTEGTASIKIVENIQPEHILKLNELIKRPGNVSEELVDLYFQFLTDCGFFNVIKRDIACLSIKIPNFEIENILRERVLSGLLKKKTEKFNSSKISAFIASLKSLADISASLRDNNISLCIEVAKCIANLYTDTKIPSNHFEIQADLYHLVKRIDDSCYTELNIDSGNSPRIDIFFKINVNTSVVMEIKHFNSANSVDAALKQILYKKYYKVCLRCGLGTENKILLGVFLAADAKISVGCLVNIDEENRPEVIMAGRVCVDSEGNTLFPLNEEIQVNTNSNL